MSLLNVESYVFINIFYLVLFCIHVCVDDVIGKKRKEKKEKEFQAVPDYLVNINATLVNFSV